MSAERPAATTHAELDLFAHLASETRKMWERHGYVVHVQSNDKRVVVRCPK